MPSRTPAGKWYRPVKAVICCLGSSFVVPEVGRWVKVCQSDERLWLSEKNARGGAISLHLSLSVVSSSRSLLNEGTDSPPLNRFEPHHITGVYPLCWTALNYVQRVLEVTGDGRRETTFPERVVSRTPVEGNQRIAE